MAYLGRPGATAPFTTADIPDNSITAAKIVADTIAAGDLAPNSVDSSELVDGGVDLSHMSANSVDSDQYVDGSIDTAHIGDDQVTGAKLANDIAISTTGAITTTGAFTSIGINDDANALAMTIDSDENVAIGKTPADYYSNFRTLEVGGGDTGTLGIAGRTGDAAAFIYKNAYFDQTNIRDEFLADGRASCIVFGAGGMILKVSDATGSADGAITWKDGITIAQDSGVVGIGHGQTIYSSTPALEVGNSTSGVPALVVKGGTLATYTHGVRTDPTSGGIQIGYHTNYRGTICFNSGGSTELQIETNYSGSGIVCKANSNGVRLASGGTSWGSLSDERFKDIEENITDALVKINKLRSVIGKYKTDEDGTRRSFLIAQDFLDNFPEAVTVPVTSKPKFEGDEVTDPDKIGMDLRYTDVIPLLVASVKELSAKVTTLENA